MYVSEKRIMEHGTRALKALLLKFLQEHSVVHCKALKNRKVFLDKLPEVVIQRKDCKNRLQAFWVAINIIQKSHDICKKGSSEYELRGISADGRLVIVHLREEVQKKDRKLFFISTYYAKKKVPSP